MTKKIYLETPGSWVAPFYSTFDLECHGQTSLKVVFVKFAHVFMKFRKLQSLQMENKKLHHKHSLFFEQN